jgi:ATP-binding cassette subfamily F protein uup
VPKEQRQKKAKAPQEKKRLSFKETRELESLPPLIEALEEEKRQLTETLNSPECYAGRDLERIRTVNDRWGALEKELDAAYHRWDELEELKAVLAGPSER